jgi:predicted phage terminase large subunit-like protein
MRVFNGECKRLVINIPPRYSKSELAVANFIAWALGHFPDAEFIHASYSSDLAALNAMNAREIVQHEAYREVFPRVRLRVDSNARDHWRTTAGGVVYARGSGGTITGFGAGKVRDGFGGAIICDDMHKPDEALSDVERPKVIRWFQNTLESRKNDPKRTPIIVIGQRLHEEDLPGWLLSGGNGEAWESIVLPALRPDNTALWPEKHTVEDLLRMQEVSPYTFTGQYQQRPTPPEGGLFKPDKIEILESWPNNIVQWVRGWDLAATQAGGDWTAGCLIGRTQDNRFVIGDMQRLQGAPDMVEARIVSAAQLDGRRVKVSLPQDAGQAGKMQVLYLTRALAGFKVASSPESGEKEVRAAAVAAQVNIGNVAMVGASGTPPSFMSCATFRSASMTIKWMR